MSYKEVAEALDKLSPTELEQIQSRILFIRKGKKVPEPKIESEPLPPASEASSFEQALWKQLERVVDLKELKLPIFKARNKLAKILTMASLDIESMAKSMQLSREEAQQLCFVLVEIAVAELKDSNRAISLSTLLYLFSNVRELLSNSFPGYPDELIKRFVLNDTTPLHSRECSCSACVR